MQMLVAIICGGR